MAVVRWRPGYDGGYPQQMEVWYRLSSDSDYEWRWSPHLSASVTLYQILGLQVEQPYLFSVRGINREGAGHFSDMVEAKGIPTVINRDPGKSGEPMFNHGREGNERAAKEKLRLTGFDSREMYP